jgi:uncharacterized protein YpiB (UPF0302 family)
LGQLRYRKLIVISFEGIKTEPQYFAILQRYQSTAVHLHPLKGKHDSSPDHVLKRIKVHLKSAYLKSSDAAWIVIDKDHWAVEQLNEVYQWSLEAENYGLALSNPNFEYWLLLHFEDGAGISSARDCTARLERHLSRYDKNLSNLKISKLQVLQAIERAKQRDNPPCEGWPRSLGASTVYRLAEIILSPDYADNLRNVD